MVLFVLVFAGLIKHLCQERITKEQIQKIKRNIMMKTNLPFFSLTKVVFSCLLLLAATGAVSAQGWQTWFYFGSGGDFAKNDIVDVIGYTDNLAIVVAQATGGVAGASFTLYTVAGDENLVSGQSGVNLPTGEEDELDYYPIAGVTNTADTVYVLVERTDELAAGQSLYLVKMVRVAGSVGYVMDWHKPLYDLFPDYVFGASLVKTNDGQIMALGTVTSDVTPDDDGTDMLMVKVDYDGNVLWSNIQMTLGGDRAVQIIPAADGGYWVLKENTVFLPGPTTTSWLVKTDEFGETVSETMLAGTEGDDVQDMILTADGGFAICGQTADEALYVLKIDAAGNILWRQDYTSDSYTAEGLGIIEDAQGNLVVSGSLTYLSTSIKNAFIVKLQSDGTPLWERDYPRSGNAAGFVADVFNDLTLTPAGQYLMGGARFSGSNPGTTFAYFVKTDTFGLTKGGNIRGNVFHDLDLDCTAGVDDLNLEDWVVQVSNDSLNFFGNTDAQGNYAIPVFVTNGNPVNYTVSITPLSSYWEPCVNDIPVTIDYLDTLAVDFALQAVVECSLIETHISSTNFRPCDTTEIAIDYCNIGTITSEDTYMEVELNDDLTFVTATSVPTQIMGNTYTFDLDDLAIDDCGSLMITALLACDTMLLGQASCITAHVYPDTICPVPGENWTGALLNARYTCADGNIQFEIENVGTQSMATDLQYVIIEDAVLLREGIYNLDPDQEMLPDVVPQNGSTYTLIAQQEPGAPGAELISIGADACPNEGSPELNEFAQYTGDPYSVTYCPIVVGSYDPNDKQAIPAGFGEDHGISANTPIEYTIRFQNTGTDTAFRVVIKDELSPFLDPSTLRPGPSSHPYEWYFEDQAVVFHFPNIELPDSSANLAASQGFVSFRIDQDDRLPAETRIENSAGIYFDFNAPIITNTVFHTVKEFIDIINETVVVADPSLTVNIAPNPIKDGARIWVEGLSAQSTDLHLQLFDASGKLQRTMAGDDDGFWLQRGNLPAGMYFFTISNEQGWLANGKLVVQ